MNGNFFLQNMFFIIVSMTFFTPFFAIEVSVFDSNNGFKKPVTDHLTSDNDYKNSIKDQKSGGFTASKIDTPHGAAFTESSHSALPLDFQDVGGKDFLPKDNIVLGDEIVESKQGRQDDRFKNDGENSLKSGVLNFGLPDPVVQAEKIELVLKKVQDFTQLVKKEQIQLKQDVFQLNMILIDSVTDGTSLKEEKIVTMYQLLKDIVLRQDFLNNQLSSVDQSLHVIEVSKNDFPVSAVNQLIASKLDMQSELKIFWDIILDSYKRLASNFQNLADNLSKSDDHKNEIKELDRCKELLDENVKRVFEKKGDKEKEKCFFLAGKVELLREKFDLLQEHFEGFQRRIVLEKDFQEAIQTVKESLDKLKNDREAMAECPVVVQQRQELSKKLDIFLKEIENVSIKK